MLKLLCVAVIAGVVLAEKPLYGTPECHQVLAEDCSSYPDEPVCAFVHDSLITLHNSCEFAHALCSFHGHSVYAEHHGPCE